MSKFPRIFLGLSFSAFLYACQPGPGETELSGSVQGTTYHIKMALAGLEANPEELRQQVEKTFSDIDVKLSNYRDDSEISRINANKTVDWLPVSPEIAELIGIAKVVHAKSGGCYDLTVKPVFDLWGFSRHEMKIPEQADIDQALKHVGLDKVLLDAANSRIRKLDPEVGIDLSSIAQGYTVGAVAKLLEARGIQNYLAEIGGEMKIKGRKANGQEWKIAVEKPTPFTREVQKILAIHQENGTSVMTSGTYRNFFEQGGQVYSHIINPKTGRPVTHRLLSVTVLHDNPTWADAWSTALLCLGEEKGFEATESEGLRALLIYGEEGQLKERLSGEMLKSP
jgi:thiamine biosynthesis lipoprotein